MIKLLKIICFYIFYFLYVIFTNKESETDKDIECISIQQDSFSQNYNYQKNKFPVRNYLTFEEFKELYYPED